jgi:radical SAM-linked protein
MRVFERAIRRACIPIAMSKGFNPHPKLSILLALSVGIASKDEILEMELLKLMPLEILVKRLAQHLPKEMHILSIESVPHGTKSLIHNIIYEIVFKDPNLLKTLKISEFLRQASIIVNRSKNGHQKPFDIRPSIQEITVEASSLILSIKMTPEGLSRPEEVLQALCINEKKEFFEITRTKINLSSPA